MAFVVYFCLKPPRLYIICCLSHLMSLQLYGMFVCFRLSLRGYITFVVCFCLKPPRLYDIYYVFLLNDLEATWHLLFCSCLTPPRIHGICYLFPPETSEAIRHLLCIFCLTPLRLYGIILLFLPDASADIWHVTCFRLTPPRLYGTCYVFLLFVFAWRLRGYVTLVMCSHCLFLLNTLEAILAFFDCVEDEDFMVRVSDVSDFSSVSRNWNWLKFFWSKHQQVVSDRAKKTRNHVEEWWLRPRKPKITLKSDDSGQENPWSQ